VSMEDPATLWYGFCQRMLESNAAIMNNVAQHFRQGLDMRAWVSHIDRVAIWLFCRRPKDCLLISSFLPLALQRRRYLSILKQKASDYGNLILLFRFLGSHA
jgi:hypothetical protein